MLAHNFHLKPSRYYLLVFGVIVYATIVIVCMLPIPLWLKLLAILVIAGHGARVFWRYALLRGKQSITAISYTNEKRWVIQSREGTYAVQLHPGTTVTTIVMLLHFRVPGKLLPFKSVIFRDSLPPDDYRKLLVLLSS